MIPEFEIRLARAPRSSEPVIYLMPLDRILTVQAYADKGFGAPPPGTVLRAVLRWESGEASITFKVPEPWPEERGT